ncbi:hypothetical protein EJ08DRAFT_120539 [Tothia fuscella]|uniref:Uncharacterized protein n=1 Tax=Tothia fuscella TaxID=1048955 RepID=A0A9P4NDQ7_9PEZI|nr:hypothetical protein EJ08DRAFT_120539 [Tothia fuscella]
MDSGDSQESHPQNSKSIMGSNPAHRTVITRIDHNSDTAGPSLAVSVQITNDTYYTGRREDIDVVVTATLNSPYAITIHNQGQWNSELGTLLCKAFRLNLFDWYDETAEETFEGPEDSDDEWGCEHGVYKENCLELQPQEVLVVTRPFNHLNLFCDPLMYAVDSNNHTFRLKVKPQKLKWTTKTKEELFADGEGGVPQEEYDTWGEIELASDDTIEFTIEAE